LCCFLVSAKDVGLSHSEFISASRDRPDTVIAESRDDHAHDGTESRDELEQDDDVVSTFYRNKIFDTATHDIGGIDFFAYSCICLKKISKSSLFGHVRSSNIIAL
jgi:hypothetical protein